MSGRDQTGVEGRVLLLLPYGRDAELALGVLARAGMPALACADVGELLARIEEGAGAAVIADEGLAEESASGLESALREAPPWSSLPLLVLTRAAAPAPAAAALISRLELGHGITLLQRPVPSATLLSGLRVALAARRRQYQLRDLLERLAEQLRRQDRFLAVLAHELRNPLAPLASAAELLRLPARDDQGIDWAADIIARQTRSLARLVDDLLDISRIVHGRVTLRRAPLDLREVAREAAQALQPALEPRRQRLALDLPAEAVTVDGDGLRLVQAVGNLLDNASKYSDEGGRIALTVEAGDGEAVLRVTDEGTGIPADLLPHIFDVFHQGDRSPAHSSGGLGLGLGVVKGLVELHGGQVSAASAGAGHGAELELRLPLGSAAAPAPEASPARPDGATPRRILVVEDNEDVAESFAYVLESLGHAVRIVHDGADALAAAREQPADAVFLDVGLPDLPGDEVARRLREILPAATLVALSGYDRRILGERADAFDHHLLKPAALEDIERVLVG